MKRKNNDDKFALVIYSALREWNLQPTMEECLAAIRYLKELMGKRLAKKLPRPSRIGQVTDETRLIGGSSPQKTEQLPPTYQENIQTKG